MLFTVRERGDGTEIALVVIGDIDLSTVPTFRTFLSDVCRDGRPVVIDLSGCTFLDSLGIGLLLGGARRASAGLSIVGAVGSVRSVLSLTGADRLVEVVDDPPSAEQLGS